MFKSKTIVITGGTGTFGQAILRRFLNSEIRRDPSLLARRKEAGRHAASYKNPKLKFYIGDVREPEGLSAVMRRRRLCLPRGGAQAGALMRVLSARGPADERAGRRERA